MQRATCTGVRGALAGAHLIRMVVTSDAPEPAPVIASEVMAYALLCVRAPKSAVFVGGALSRYT